MSLRRAGFTLIEMLVAGAIAALLVGGMALMLGGLGRDRARLQARSDARPAEQTLELIRRDLTNATSVIAQPNLVTIDGFGGIDRSAMASTNRAARVVYRVRRDGTRSALVREQRFLDDPVRTEPWAEVVASGATRLTITSDATPDPSALALEADEMPTATAATSPASSNKGSAPALVRVRIEFVNGVIDQELRIR